MNGKKVEQIILDPCIFSCIFPYLVTEYPWTATDNLRLVSRGARKAVDELADTLCTQREYLDILSPSLSEIPYVRFCVCKEFKLVKSDLFRKLRIDSPMEVFFIVDWKPREYIHLEIITNDIRAEIACMPNEAVKVSLERQWEDILKPDLVIQYTDGKELKMFYIKDFYTKEIHRLQCVYGIVQSRRKLISRKWLNRKGKAHKIFFPAIEYYGDQVYYRLGEGSSLKKVYANNGLACRPFDEPSLITSVLKNNEYHISETWTASFMRVLLGSARTMESTPDDDVKFQKFRVGKPAYVISRGQMKHCDMLNKYRVLYEEFWERPTVCCRIDANHPAIIKYFEHDTGVEEEIFHGSDGTPREEHLKPQRRVYYPGKEKSLKLETLYYNRGNGGNGGSAPVC